VCNVVPDAVINVAGNIDVAAGAVLDAQSAPSTITVGHNVTAGAGSLLRLGCQVTPPTRLTRAPSIRKGNSASPFRGISDFV
jgi:hypothetical protein